MTAAALDGPAAGHFASIQLGLGHKRRRLWTGYRESPPQSCHERDLGGLFALATKNPGTAQSVFPGRTRRDHENTKARKEFLVSCFRDSLSTSSRVYTSSHKEPLELPSRRPSKSRLEPITNGVQTE